MSDKFEMNTNEYLSQCDPKDVISFDSEKWVDVNKLKEIVHNSFDSYIPAISNNISKILGMKNKFSWFDWIESCEILRAGSKGWQKGKIKVNVTLEFIPDEIEENKSPLDDIRQADLNNNL